MKKFSFVLSMIMLASLILSACATPPTAAPTAAPVVATEAPIVATEPPAPMWEAPKGALVAYPVASAPTLDGVADEAFWADAEDFVIDVDGGFGGYETKVNLKAVYTADSVYFLMTYKDPTESWYRYPWIKQEDGTWKQDKDPSDKGGDNNLHYEDKIAFIWPINNSIDKFETKGCYTACHADQNADVKPYGNKYTAKEGELGDIWHWKSVRNLNQIDDQYVDWTTFEARVAADNGNKEAGRKADPKDSGGYSDNYASMPDPADATKTVADHSMPGFISPNTDTATGAPGYILDSEKVAVTKAELDAMPAGTIIPGIVKSEIVGDRGQISAGWKWADGMWTLEFGRLLDTASEFDVEFTDLAASYYFGVAVFENAQVRHATETGASFLVFKPQ